MLRVFGSAVLGTLFVACTGCVTPSGPGSVIPDAPSVSAPIDCLPFQRDLTRPWNSKKGYCIGDEILAFKPIASPLQQPLPPQDLRGNNESLLIDDGWEPLPQKPDGSALREERSAENKGVTVAAVPSPVDGTMKSGYPPTDRVLDFQEGSSRLSKYEQEKILQILDGLKITNEVKVIWLQASLTPSETSLKDDSERRLGIERSLAVKQVLARNGVKDVRIIYSIENAQRSSVNILLKGEA